MQSQSLFIFLIVICLLYYIDGHLAYKYRNRNRPKVFSRNHNAQALTAENPSTGTSSSVTHNPNNNHVSLIECDFLNHKETGCEDEIGSRCDLNTSKCVCKESHPVRLLDFCLKVSRLNGPCYTSGQCSVVLNASCYIFGKEYDLETASGGHNLGRLVKNWPLGICKCRLGFAYNVTTNACEKRLIGSWCSTDKHCLLRSLNSICDKKRGECECAWGTRYEPKHDTCVPDTSVNTLTNTGSNFVGSSANGKTVYYLSKCEQDSDCTMNSNTLTSSGISTTSSPSTPYSSTIASSVSSSTVTTQKPNLASSTASLLKEKTFQSEQSDQEIQHNLIRHFHGHRRYKESYKRMSSFHLKELQCIRGRCMCSTIHAWDGSLHCKEPIDNQSSHNGTHRHNRKNYNVFGELDDDSNDDFDDEDSINWQTIFFIIIGSCLFAGFIFRYCYNKKNEDDDELSEGLRSPDGLYSHKTIDINREHPFNPVAVAFLSKPNPVTSNGCNNHFDPNYGFIASTTPGCYHHDFDYGYDSYNMCNGTSPHPSIINNQMMGHMSKIGKPPKEEDEDAYLEKISKENEKQDNDKKNNLNENIAKNSNTCNCDEKNCENKISNQCCRCDCIKNKNFNSKFSENSPKLNSDDIDAFDRINFSPRDGIDCFTPVTTTTITGRTSCSSNEDEDLSKLNNDNNDQDQIEPLTSLINQKSSMNIFIKNETTNENDFKEPIKKWCNTIEKQNLNNKTTKNSDGKANLPLLIESQTEQFQIA